MAQLVPTAVAAVALGVTPSAVRKLIERRKLTRYGTPSRSLVDLGEVSELAEKRTAEAALTPRVRRSASLDGQPDPTAQRSDR